MKNTTHTDEQTQTKETYTQQKDRHSKELNDFQGIFFAFSNKQFDEGMIKVGLTPQDKDKVYSIGKGTNHF